MRHFSTTIDIQAPRERVLAVLSDVERWPQWTTTTTSVQRMDSGPFAVGSKARVLQPKLRPAIWTVTELDDRSFTWVTGQPGVQTKAGHVVETAGDRCRVTLSIEYSGALATVAAYLYRELTQQYIETEARGLRDRCETR